MKNRSSESFLLIYIFNIDNSYQSIYHFALWEDKIEETIFFLLFNQFSCIFHDLLLGTQLGGNITTRHFIHYVECRIHVRTACP